MRIAKEIFKALDRISPAKIAYAHCDIPCGIYDPHHAQMAAQTIIRMNMLIKELPDPTHEQKQEWHHKFTRYTAVKEQHAEIVKHEVRIIWGDFFKPEHVAKFPETHELVWKIMKLASKARQEVNLQASEELLDSVNKFAEMFWKAKGADVVKAKAPGYPTEKEIVLPKAK